MKNDRDFLIITNNPLAAKCMAGRFEMRLYEELSYREILVVVRDLIYAGHKLYTHPLAGSVKPNETPYRSVVVSRDPGKLDFDDVQIISNAIERFDIFTPRHIVMTEKLHNDFQLIDYTLLAGAVDFDAVAGLSRIKDK